MIEAVPEGLGDRERVSRYSSHFASTPRISRRLAAGLPTTGGRWLAGHALVMAAIGGLPNPAPSARNVTASGTSC